MEDSRIVELYWLRDESAIAETANKYGSFCNKIAKNILTVKEDVEECVNDVYHKAWDSIPPQRPEKLGAWLGKVVRNTAINIWNSNHAQRRYAGITKLLDELEDCIPSTHSVESSAGEGELTAVINSWLMSLDSCDRVLFMRRYWYGEPLKTLEHEYGMTHGKMAKRMFLLRTRLREAIEKEGYSI